MKSITSLLAVVALGSTVAFAADEKPAAPTTPPAPAAPGTPAKPEAAAGAAKPEEKPKKDPAEAFKKLDTNGDGTLSKAEFMASPGAKKDPAKAEASFAKKGGTDTKGLTLEEFSAGGKKKDK